MSSDYCPGDSAYVVAVKILKKLSGPLGGGGGGDPFVQAKYLVQEGHAGLTSARVLVGTEDQIVLTEVGETLVLSLPQDVDLSSSPQFAGVLFTGPARFGGITSDYPALLNVGEALHARRADDSAFAEFRCGDIFSNDAPVRGYCLQMFSSSGANPTDSVTTYFGMQPGQVPSGVYNNHKIVVPKSGTITRLDFRVHVAGTLGSGELVSHKVRVNDATDVGAVDFSYAAVTQEGSGAVSFDVVAGDFLAVKMVQPAWGTNPTSVRYYASILIE